MDRRCEEFRRNHSARDKAKFEEHLNQQREVGAAFAQANTEFPNIGGQQAELYADDLSAAPVYKEKIFAFMYYFKILFTAVLGLLASGTGVIILLGVMAQATPTGATAVAKHSDTPGMIDISVNLPIVAAGVGANMTNEATSRTIDAAYSTLKEGIAWDSCAGAWLIPNPDCFVSWDKSPIQYIKWL